MNMINSNLAFPLEADSTAMVPPSQIYDRRRFLLGLYNEFCKKIEPNPLQMKTLKDVFEYGGAQSAHYTNALQVQICGIGEINSSEMLMESKRSQ